LWTNQLWFSSLGLSRTFSTLFVTKVGLGLAFGILFFALMWGNLLLTNRFGASTLTYSSEDELIRRFQNTIRPYAARFYALVALVTGFIAGMNAVGQWQNFLLFTHAQKFHRLDPVFHKDLGFYIFTLPFLQYVVTWLLVALFVVLLFTAVFHYLNGGIRAAASPRVSPRVKAHLSSIGVGIALLKAAGYLIAKWELVVSTNGYVEGAGYTDIHARIPALTILFWLSLAAAVILLVNIRTRGWSLPAVAVGLWMFVALIIGVAYPAILQTLKVSPNQNALERPYIQRNIDATRAAFAINNVHYISFAGATTLTPKQVTADEATLNNVRLWDPSSNISLVTVNKRQSLRSYYQFTQLGVDRYVLNGKLTPVLIGARQLNSSELPSQSWVNEHLQYTHGIGAAVVIANQSDPSTGNPNMALANVPPVSTNGLPTLTQPDIYFGINNPGWVVANTKQPELDYQVSSGTAAGNLVESHYAAKGGVAVGNILQRAALALRLGDFNFLISNEITPSSRVLFDRDVVQMAQTAAPFLSFDSEPYAVIANGSVQFVLDGYTTTDQYPYSQNASSLNVGQEGLPASFNYVRNSVKVVVNAYTGKMTFYAFDPTDPILKAYMAAFPGMFKSASTIPPSISSHLHYPGGLFGVQAATLASYHIKSAAAFFDASDQWEISPTTGAGTPDQTIQQSVTTNANGQIVSVANTPMSPVLTVGALPNTSEQQLLESIEFVPAGNSSTVQGLSAFMTATSNLNDYGQLNVYVTPRGQTVTGPVQADAEIEQNATVSSITTPLDQHGSSVLLGNNMMVPLDNSILYVRPMYVTSTANPLPQLKYVITVFNQQVGIAPTLAGSLSQVLGTAVSTGSTSTTSTSTPTTTTGKSAAYYLGQASTDYTNAQAALSAGDLGQYQADVNAMNTQLGLAQKALSTTAK
jgi:uncharacterized membrane protein (UPF0182 family)